MPLELSNMLKTLLASKWCRVGLSALSALLGYGGWAYWINMTHGSGAAMKAAIVQGGYSFVLTCLLSLLIEFLYQRYSHWRYGVVLIGVVVCCLLYSLSWGINVLAMTPEILWTILPGALISTLFTISYLLGLKELNPTGLED